MQTDENRFLLLLGKHLDNKATPEEVQELLQLIKSGQYDKLLKHRIDDALVEKTTERDISYAAAHRMLYKILSSEERTDRLIPGVSPFVKYRLALSAAAAVLIVVAAVWLLWPASSRRPLVQQQMAAKIVAPDTAEGKYIRLPDGSRVLLHGGSQLIVGATFNTKTREVSLSGEGYFDIHPDDKRPFIVHTGSVNTTVLGTAFNVRAWPGQSAIVVTVTSGKVKVSNPQQIYGVIGSNEQIAVDVRTNGFTNQTVDLTATLAWKKEYLVLDDVPLVEAARLIGEKYHVNIRLGNKTLTHCRISATFLAHESLGQVLDIVSAVIEGAYTLEPNNQIILNGKGCN